MILDENVQVLTGNYSAMLDLMVQRKETLEAEPVTLSLARNGSLTLSVVADDKTQFIHSQYDPVNEAEKLVAQFSDTDAYQHVFFYGVGLGYHIEKFLAEHPHFSFSLFEPNPAVMYRFLCNKSLTAFPVHNMRNLYLEWNEESLNVILGHFLRGLSEKVLLFVHPSYDRIYQAKTKRFKARFVESANNERAHMQTGLRFERLWTLNSVQNFKTLMETPSMLREKRPYFEGKPAVIVAAGPSLEEEFDNLKYIKDNKLAYIFSVGSANKALLKQNIKPDAVFAYDPETGYMGLDVFGEIITDKIDDIPLVFGSSVGHITVANYPGPLLHMVTTQDSVAPYFMTKEELRKKGEFVSDAPSIALVTFEALAKLGCNPIILVGQNFGFKNNQYYASGIQYGVRPTELGEMEKLNMVTVPGVDGNPVQTFISHNRSREGMESYIAAYPNIEVINTTKGGAKIKGTSYETLDSLLESRLLSPSVIRDWWKGEPASYDKESIKEQAAAMGHAFKQANVTIDNIFVLFKQIDKMMRRKDPKIERKFPEFDGYIEKLYLNPYFVTFIRPMARIQQETLVRYIPTLRSMSDPYEKAQKLMEMFGKFVAECKVHMSFMEEEFNKLQHYILHEMPSEVQETPSEVMQG